MSVLEDWVLEVDKELMKKSIEFYGMKNFYLNFFDKLRFLINLYNYTIYTYNYLPL